MFRQIFQVLPSDLMPVGEKEEEVWRTFIVVIAGGESEAIIERNRREDDIQ